MSDFVIVKESWHTDPAGVVIRRWEINGSSMDTLTAHPMVPFIGMPPRYAANKDVGTIEFNPEKA